MSTRKPHDRPKYTEPKHHRPVATCPTTGKVGWVTRKLAKRAAARYPGSGERPYRCHDCGLWHLGHLAGRTRAEHREHRGWE